MMLMEMNWSISERKKDMLEAGKLMMAGGAGILIMSAIFTIVTIVTAPKAKRKMEEKMKEKYPY